MPSDNNAPLAPDVTSNRGGDPHNDVCNLYFYVSKQWSVDVGLCGFRADGLDGPEISPLQVASYVDDAAPSVKQVRNVSTDIVTSHTAREANYAHFGWSIDAIRIVSPWTISRIGATNRINEEGTWYTRIAKVACLKVQVVPEDLAPAPEFEAATEAALSLPTARERFQAVYGALARW
ncbi:hypothetical protein RSOLAG1IB_10083 [Rhizoctonia solani AG-1 IB]|uniref:Uncharacterized protein n=1 Tax=Thanatephorus cucumeris (strain AG1-IB / isolate 7/3/14) TaxID=1108050 RepID=A0A0B7FUX5_THACB|nr:hypothetical protein RSOLAG1IB_10083 [Rhizoctonia solani AG-1 IB]